MILHPSYLLNPNEFIYSVNSTLQTVGTSDCVRIIQKTAQNIDKTGFEPVFLIKYKHNIVESNKYGIYRRF